MIAWIDLSVSLTPRTLEFYQRLIQNPSLQLRTSTAVIFRSFVAKGIKEPQDKLEELKVLDIVGLLEPLEAQTRDVGDDQELLAFRAALAAIYAAYATALIELEENVRQLPRHLDEILLISRPRLLKTSDKRQRVY
jgi:exportin-T